MKLLMSTIGLKLRWPFSGLIGFCCWTYARQLADFLARKLEHAATLHGTPALIWGASSIAFGSSGSHLPPTRSRLFKAVVLLVTKTDNG